MGEINQKPQVGVGIIIFKNNKVLVGKRKASHGAGEYAFPGGHLEFGETIFETAKREVKEETDLDVNEFEFFSVAVELRYIISDSKLYLNLGVKAVYNGGEPKAMEPDKCEEWKWFDLNNLPDKIYEGTGLILRNYLDKQIYQPK